MAREFIIRTLKTILWILALILAAELTWSIFVGMLIYAQWSFSIVFWGCVVFTLYKLVRWLWEKS